MKLKTDLVQYVIYIITLVSAVRFGWELIVKEATLQRIKM